MNLGTQLTPSQEKLAAIAAELQNEVNSILTNVDESAIFAEFRDEDVMNIQQGDTQISQKPTTFTFEDRISLHKRYQPRYTSFTQLVEPRIEHSSRTIRAMIFSLFKISHS